jgi:hypothetical protein
MSGAERLQGLRVTAWAQPASRSSVDPGPNPADWISAGANVFAAVGTVGAFAFAFYLFLRDQERTRGAHVTEVYAVWRRTGAVIFTDQIQARLNTIYSKDGCHRDGVPDLRVAPHHDSGRDPKPPWYSYQLWIRNATHLPVNTVEVWITMHDGLDCDAQELEATPAPSP